MFFVYLKNENISANKTIFFATIFCLKYVVKKHTPLILRNFFSCILFLRACKNCQLTRIQTRSRARQALEAQKAVQENLMAEKKAV